MMLAHKVIGYGDSYAICLHGFGGNSDSLISVATAISPKYRVILVDLYGTKLSPHPDKILTIEDYVDAVLDIIFYYKIDKVTLIGHSFGGRIILKLARYYGHIVDKIILIDAAGLKPRRHLSYYLKVAKHKSFQKLNISSKGGSADYKALKGFARASFVKIVNQNMDGNLKFITNPTLIIWGKLDKDTPIYMAKKLARNIHNSKLIVLDGGHFVYLEKRSIVNQYIKEFLKV